VLTLVDKVFGVLVFGAGSMEILEGNKLRGVSAVEMQFKRDISRSRLRQKIWISLVAAELVFLVVAIVKFS